MNRKLFYVTTAMCLMTLTLLYNTLNLTGLNDWNEIYNEISDEFLRIHIKDKMVIHKHSNMKHFDNNIFGYLFNLNAFLISIGVLTQLNTEVNLDLVQLKELLKRKNTTFEFGITGLSFNQTFFKVNLKIRNLN